MSLEEDWRLERCKRAKSPEQRHTHTQMLFFRLIAKKTLFLERDREENCVCCGRDEGLAKFLNEVITARLHQKKPKDTGMEGMVEG